MDDLISRQAAIGAVLDRMDVEKHGRDAKPEEIKWTLEKLPSAQRWISCSERLPEDREEIYWVCTDSGDQCLCRWTNTNHIFTSLSTDWHWHLMDKPQYSKVVAWMPLPEPYEMEK